MRINSINYDKLRGTGSLNKKGKKKRFSLFRNKESLGVLTATAAMLLMLLSGCNPKTEAPIVTEEPPAVVQTEQEEKQEEEPVKFSFLADRLEIENLRMTDYLTAKIEKELADAAKANQGGKASTAPNNSGSTINWVSREEAEREGQITYNNNIYIDENGKAWTSYEEYLKSINESKEDKTDYSNRIYEASDGTPFWNEKDRDEYEDKLRDDDSHYSNRIYEASDGTPFWNEKDRDEYEARLRDENSSVVDEETELRAGYYDGYYYTGATKYGGTNQWFQSYEAYLKSLESTNTTINEERTNTTDYADTVYEASDGTPFWTPQDRDAYEATLNAGKNNNSVVDEETELRAGYYDGYYYTGATKYGGTDQWFQSYEAYLESLESTVSAANITATASGTNTTDYADTVYEASDGTPFWTLQDRDAYEAGLNNANTFNDTLVFTESTTNGDSTYQVDNERIYIDGGYIDNKTGQFIDRDGDTWSSYEEYQSYMIEFQQQKTL